MNWEKVLNCARKKTTEPNEWNTLEKAHWIRHFMQRYEWNIMDESHAWNNLDECVIMDEPSLMLGINCQHR